MSAVCGSYFSVPRPSDRGDIGVAGPPSDGESVRHLDQMPVRVDELVFGVARHHATGPNLDDSPVAEQFYALTLDHPFTPAHRENICGALRRPFHGLTSGP
jgi:hypothetical protein